jgi:hypothetical protein
MLRHLRENRDAIKVFVEIAQPIARDTAERTRERGAADVFGEMAESVA